MKNRKLANVFTVLIFIFFCMVLFSQKMIIENFDKDLNVVITLLSLLLMLANIKGKFFKSASFNLFIYLTICFQILLMILSFFEFNDKINDFYTSMTIIFLIEIYVYLIKILYINQVFNDVNLIESRVKKNLRKIKNEKSDEKRIALLNDSLKKMLKWTRDNQNIEKITNTDLEVIFSILNKIIDEYLKNLVSFSTEVDSLDIEGELALFYLKFRKNRNLKKSFLELILKIIRVELIHGNNKLSEKYITFYCNSLLSLQKREVDDSVDTMIFICYSNFIKDNFDELDDISIGMLRHGLFNMLTELVIFDYDLDKNVYSSFFKSYLDGMDCINRKCKSTYSEEELLKIIMLMVKKLEKKEFEFFQSYILTRLIESSENSSLQYKTLDDIKEIYIHNFKNDNLVSWIASSLADKLSKDDENKEKIISDIVYISRYVPMDLKYSLNLSQFYIKLSELEEKEIDEFFEEKARPIFSDKDNFKYFLLTFDDFIEANLDKSLVIFKHLIENAPIEVLVDNSAVIMTNVESLTKEILVKHVNENKKISEKIAILFEILRDFYNFVDFNEKSIRYITEFLYRNSKNKNLELECYSMLKKIGISSLEAFQPAAARIVSNYLGWYLYNLIEEEIGNCIIQKTLNVMKFCFKYFSLSCDFMDENTSIFIGTIFVVNLTNYEFITTYKKIKKQTKLDRLVLSCIEDLNDHGKEILNKSFRIRKESIGTYFEKENINESDLAILCNNTKKKYLKTNSKQN
ncbi:MAG: hypothetical protein RR738_05105 [Anaerorhabdus sp.]|uniref:hypothetical protein n=1 Tax=Anaerorhabdus sp. TaxID=1872524 RepID=UPI002FC6D216